MTAPTSTPPSGTFLANVRNGVIQFPPPLREWCVASGWNLFRVLVETPDSLRLEPDNEDEPFGEEDGETYESSFDPEGRLWIPSELREIVSLRDQMVMIRIENGLIRIFLRKVFDTLGFRP